MVKHLYEVGIMSDKVKIEAPNKEVAALFYGLNSRGNMQLGAVIYTEDGKECGELPFGEYQFDFNISEEKLNGLKRKIEKLKPLLKECRFWKEEER